MNILVIGMSMAFLGAAVAKPPGPDAGPHGTSIPADAGVADATYAYLAAPLFSEDFAATPIARVEDDLITLKELTAALAGAHEAHGKEAKAGKQNFAPILDRLIEVHLIAYEAREMGIADLPEVKAALDESKRTVGRDLVKAALTAGIKPDPDEVDRLFKDAVREWKVRSVLATQEEDARRLVDEVKAGKAFDALAKDLVAQKKAQGGDEAQVLSRGKLLPEVQAQLEKMKVGEVSAPFKLGEGFAVLRLEDLRYPEDPKARAEAEASSVGRQKKEVLEKAFEGLVKRYVKTDNRLLKSLDYEAKKPGVEALRKDKRVIARIEGAEPIRVADLTEELAGAFFHGAENAASKRKLNRQKVLAFEGLCSKRIVPLEVTRLGIPDRDEFKRRVAEYETGVLFNKFLEKAVVPALKVQESDSKKYYEDHKKDYTYPAFYKLESLTFANVKSAQAALDKLRAKTDFKWLSANAEGQVKGEERKLEVEGTLASTGMPKELADLLAGANKGDFRLYSGPQAQYHVVHVLEVTPATAQPFEQARKAIDEKLFGEALSKAIKDWAAKLRKARTVKVFITKIGS